MARPPRHLPALDGLRGLAILAVIVFHFTFESGAAPPVLSLDRRVLALLASGWWGVDLFFVLSGFLITGILLDLRPQPGALRTFYVRRLLRIFPLYYGALAVFFVLAAAEHAPVSADNRHSALLFLTNFTLGLSGFNAFPHGLIHFWSLAVEEQFYLVWPWVVLGLSRRRLAQVCAACIGVALVVRALCAFRLGLPVAAYTLMPARMDGLAAGALLALAARREGGLERLRKPALALGAIGLVGALAVWLGSGAFLFTLPAVVVQAPTCLVAIFAAVLVRVLTAAPSSLSARMLSSGPLPFLGRYSYGLYVVHYPLFFALRALGLSAQRFPAPGGSVLPGIVAQGAIAMAASVGVALLSWHLLEKHFLRLKDRLGKEPLVARSPLPATR